MTGLWDATEGSTVGFSPHLRAINCISVSADDTSKVLTTAHDGTVRRADLNQSVFDLVSIRSKHICGCPAGSLNSVIS